VIPTSSPAGSVRVLVGGRAHGTAIVLDEPLSFWGGFDVATGRVIEPRHPQHGAGLTNRILVMPSGRGSSSSSSILAEALRTGTAPAGIVTHEPDSIIVLGAVVARELYGRSIPVVTVPSEDAEWIRSGSQIEVDAEREPAQVRAVSS
jgi:predicted aconitase with swiveling domain